METGNTMETGYVFAIAANLFGIYRKDSVDMLCRFDDAETAAWACRSFSRKFAGRFIPAGPEVVRLARAKMMVRDTVLLVDN